MEYICSCGKVFSSSQAINGHKAKCKVHLGEEKYLQFYNNQIKKINQVKEKLKAFYAKKREIELDKIRICEKCKEEYTWKKTQPFYSKRFCSKHCSHSHNISEEQKQKTSKSLRLTHSQNDIKLKNYLILHPNEENIPYFKKCSRCGVEFICYNRHRKNCDNCKGNKGLHYKVKDSSKMGGLREKGGKVKKYITYTNKYNNTMVLNQYECKIAEYLDTLSYEWNRNLKGFNYIDEKGKLRKFYPDFYISDLDLYVEFKGWNVSWMKHKMKDAQFRNPDLKLKIIYMEKRHIEKEDDVLLKDLIPGISVFE